MEPDHAPAPVTSTVWITRQITTLAHIEALAMKLRDEGAVDVATVKIIAIEPDWPVSMPDPRTGAQHVLTYDNLPAEGIVFIPA